ncbi:MAG: DUF1801 domain-containing protein [Hyphomicrobiales bacterium]|nr:DUF1801 domain-containing protein [Hyphomicrobiales bacterium]MCP5001658.1 DUF1801 domain-containing protein [Hyphomicrobiales bacterium]
MTPFQSSDVEAVYSSYPGDMRDKMLMLRELVFLTASETDGVGTIKETLKWGEPSYLTVRPKSGTTIRVNWHPDRPADFSVYFHCQTNLISTCQELYPNLFDFEGNRRMSYAAAKPPPEDALKHCLALALTYHRRKRR